MSKARSAASLFALVGVLGAAMVAMVITTGSMKAPSGGGEEPLTYYVDSVRGNDASPGFSASAPWRTLRPVNRQRLQPGDSVLFRRDGSWNGTIVVSASGERGAPVTYGAYGSGEPPTIGGRARAIVMDNVHDIVVEQLRLADVGGSAVHVDHSRNVTLRRMAVAGAQGHGIAVWNSAGIAIEDSMIADVHDDGIWAWNIEGLSVTRNRVERVYGLYSDNCQLTRVSNYEIVGNYFSLIGSDSGKGNYHAEAGHGGLVLDNQLVGGNYGIDSVDSAQRIEGNRTSDHRGRTWSAGIHIYGGEPASDLSDVEIVANHSEGDNIGIYVWGPERRKNLRLRNNVVKDAGRAGILIESAIEGEITGNKVWSSDRRPLLALDLDGERTERLAIHDNLFGPDGASFVRGAEAFQELAAFQRSLGQPGGTMTASEPR